MLAEGISERRLWRYLQTLRLIAQKCDEYKPFDEWGRVTLQNVSQIYTQMDLP